MAKFEIWEDPTGSTVVIEGTNMSVHFNDLSEAKRVHTFESKTWGEALQVYNDFYGFGPRNYIKDENGDILPEYFEEI